MAKSPINFDGAKYDRLGGSYSVDREGNKTDVRYDLRITLADGTFYSKESPFYRWEKWLANKDYNIRSLKSMGHYRKCNERHAWLLDQAWKENFIAPTDIVDAVKEGGP